MALTSRSNYFPLCVYLPYCTEIDHGLNGLSVIYVQKFQNDHSGLHSTLQRNHVYTGNK